MATNRSIQASGPCETWIIGARGLTDPEVVRESAKDPNVHLYYAASSRAFVCVVVALVDGGNGFVVTAYFTNEVKKGRELWTK